MSSGFDLTVLEELTSNAKQIQDDVLTEILKANANTEYLRGFLHGSFDTDLFKNNVPVVTYEDFKPYIDRVMNGEPSDIISGNPITRFFPSSGISSGNPKKFPGNDIFFDKVIFVSALRSLVMAKHFEGFKQGKMLNFIFTSSMYCQPLCGLVQRDEVLSVGAIFVSVLVQAIHFLEDYWKELSSNIRFGRVSEWITDLSCRDSGSMILGEPNPDLADLIEHKCGQQSSEGIISRLWPKTKFIEGIVTGNLAQYIPTLEFYSNKLPIVSTTYASSETYFGINVDPLSKHVPNAY
ncbi:unnamed protein product [Arabis nemorensis]|uniref:GH3 auxin-responsive promoter n=1 Tax=Arabis nemorensis TaxID=586526 RepID=A0A565AP92_9BRAS|nr:unnamed protein product [Arabis nemorensis]